MCVVWLVAVPEHTFWYVDVVARIITGKYPVGVAKYVEKKETHLVTST